MTKPSLNQASSAVMRLKQHEDGRHWSALHLVRPWEADKYLHGTHNHEAEAITI